jgi:hypothetical protein
MVNGTRERGDREIGVDNMSTVEVVWMNGEKWEYETKEPMNAPFDYDYDFIKLDLIDGSVIWLSVSKVRSIKVSEVK